MQVTFTSKSVDLIVTEVRRKTRKWKILTFIKNIGRHMNSTVGQVNLDVVEMFVLLKFKYSIFLFVLLGF